MNFDCLPANYKTHRHTRSLTHSQTHTSLQTITISGIWVFMKEKRISHKEWARERQKAVIEARIFISLFNNNKKTQNIHFEHMGIFIGRVCNRAQMLTPFFTNSFARLHIHNLFISILLFFSFLFILVLTLLPPHFCFMFFYRLISPIQGAHQFLSICTIFDEWFCIFVRWFEHLSNSFNVN